MNYKFQITVYIYHIRKLHCRFLNKTDCLMPFANMKSKLDVISPNTTGHLKITSGCPKLQYILDVLWGPPIKLIQVVSTSEFYEYLMERC